METGRRSPRLPQAAPLTSYTPTLLGASRSASANEREAWLCWLDRSLVDYLSSDSDYFTETEEAYFPVKLSFAGLRQAAGLQALQLPPEEYTILLPLPTCGLYRPPAKVAPQT